MDIVCFQIGRREHYGVPRALLAQEKDVVLYTDLWFSERNRMLSRWFGVLNRLSARYHPDLVGRVYSATASMLLHEAVWRVRGRNCGEMFEARDQVFQKRAISWMEKQAVKPRCVIAFSYAARKIIEWCRERSIPVVLDQIDPGIYEEELVVSRFGKENGRGASAGYWASWKKELELADAIVVNSEWSMRGLEAIGVNRSKISVIPLAFCERRSRLCRAPNRGKRRVLRVLFLGQVIARKGINELLEAALILERRGVRVEITVAGWGDQRLIERVEKCSLCRFIGSVGKADIDRVYSEHDVFILPTWSDGFAITQLEALAAGMPVVVSDRCARVVRDGENGVVLPEVSGMVIADTLERLESNRQIVWQMSQAAGRVDERFSLRSVGLSWVGVVDRVCRMCEWDK